MLAIFSSSIEKASRLSEGLQSYWNSKGVYASVSLFERESEFLQAMVSHAYERVILDCADSPIGLIEQIRTRSRSCKIAVLIDNYDFVKENKVALACRNLGVDILLSRTELEQPLALLSKQLHIL